MLYSVSGGYALLNITVISREMSLKRCTQVGNRTRAKTPSEERRLKPLDYTTAQKQYSVGRLTLLITVKPSHTEHYIMYF